VPNDTVPGAATNTHPEMKFMASYPAPVRQQVQGLLHDCLLKSLRLPPAPPFIVVACWDGNRFVRFFRLLCDKGALITVFNPDPTRKTRAICSTQLSQYQENFTASNPGNMLYIPK